MIDGGVSSALQLMKHWIHIYNNLTSIRRATAGIKKFHTRAFIEFQAMDKKKKSNLSGTWTQNIKQIPPLLLANMQRALLSV